MSGERIMVGMSGGVDSSVTALLLKEAGHAVEGMFMKNWEEDDRFGACPAEADAADARAVAELVGIRLHTRNFAAEYWDQVFEHFLAEYRAGRTPNPDILCNREIKFRVFLEHAEDLGATTIATGHYARRGGREGAWTLLKGCDTGKDQSYFLYTLGQEQLARTRFPLGEVAKREVRRRAAEAGLPVATKKDSTGICFIGERNFQRFLAEYLPAQPGAIRAVDGRLLGQHEGLVFYTLGQRKGLGIGGRADATGEPWYVVHKELGTNTLYVGEGVDHPLLFSRRLEASQASWVAGAPPAKRFRCAAKTRYRQPDQPCAVEQLDDDRFAVAFDRPQRAVTPGQSVVFYDGDVCLGGAVIDAIDAPIGAIRGLEATA